METKKLNPYTKRNLVQARVDLDEMREILMKAEMYFGGDVSRLVRESLRAYRPIKKGPAK